MTTVTKTRGYATDTTAAAAAKRAGKFGVTGSGQQCLPVELPNGLGWGFWTAHSYFHVDREPGTLLLPRGVEIDLDFEADPFELDRLQKAFDLSTWDAALWLRESLGLSATFDAIIEASNPED